MKALHSFANRLGLIITLPLLISEKRTTRPSYVRYLQVGFLLLALVFYAPLWAAASPIGTGLVSNISLGALTDPSKVNRKWTEDIDYDIDLTSWKYDVYVPVDYDGTKPYGLVVYTSSNSSGVILSQAATQRNLIWIAPRNVGNSQSVDVRLGASLLAFYRAMEMFNIDPRRVYSSGLSGGARTASALAFYHSELIHGTAPSSGLAVPQLNALTPDYFSSNTGYYDYSTAFFYDSEIKQLNADAIKNKLRSCPITRYGDYRRDYITEPQYSAYEAQGLPSLLHLGSGGHQDANDAEMIDAIDYLDRDDTFPIDAKASNQFAKLDDISLGDAKAINTSTAKELIPTQTGVAAVKTSTGVYWANRNGSTFRWMWDMGSATLQNQKTSFGVWFNGENWNNGAPDSLLTAEYPGILITLTQTTAGNRIVISARPDSGGETVFYSGSFTVVPAVATAESGGTGYLEGNSIGLRLELNEKRFQIDFNGIVLDTSNSATLASGTQVEPNHGRTIFGLWDSALGKTFWKNDPSNPSTNTWSSSNKSIFTAATGAADGTGSNPLPMNIRYVQITDPGLSPPQ